MPTYEYACTACGLDLEVVQKFTDDTLTTCEVCGGSLRKVFSPVGVVFKGSGFYRTDSRSTSRGPSAGGTSDKNGASKTEKSTAADSTSTSSGSAAGSGSAGSSTSGSSSSSSSPHSSSSGPASSASTAA